MQSRILFAVVLALFSGSAIAAESSATLPVPPEIRTPPPTASPRINAVPIFGVRPGHPFLYRIPATGERPMTFAADGLPAGLRLDPPTGQITGVLPAIGEHVVTLRATNARGTTAKQFRIIVGESIALTPPMGWNTYNHYGTHISADIVRANAEAMVKSGLIDHGWTYINIDDAWQGRRGGEFNAIQGNERFPDLKGLADAVHALGLKIGIYSTPWVQSYAGYIGGSAMTADGAWSKTNGPKKPNQKILPWAVGPHSFARNDARQWAAWGFDYLKYDWNPIEPPEAREMYDALRASGRDIVYSLSNNARPATLMQHITEISTFANSWRIANDIKANWPAMVGEARAADKWRAFARPGHWNDPDMLEIGTKERNQPGLTPDEEYTHMTWWCLLAAPLLLGNDLSEMSAFTLNLLTNDEVIAIDQDELGQPATAVSTDGERAIYARPLADGTLAVGLFNLGANPANITVRWTDLKITGAHAVRDVWRQKELGNFTGEFAVPVAPHSAELIKVSR